MFKEACHDSSTVGSQPDIVEAMDGVEGVDTTTHVPRTNCKEAEEELVEVSAGKSGNTDPSLM